MHFLLNRVQRPQGNRRSQRTFAARQTMQVVPFISPVLNRFFDAVAMG
jgi:hypothetical protein